MINFKFPFWSTKKTTDLVKEEVKEQINIDEDILAFAQFMQKIRDTKKIVPCDNFDKAGTLAIQDMQLLESMVDLQEIDNIEEQCAITSLRILHLI